jgi:hypothetical protein
MPVGDASRLDFLKSIADFVIVTTPGLLLYFLGWAYLSYYLFLFGINPSELKIDAQTVFISSYIPLYGLVGSNWILSIVSILVLLFVMLALFTNLFDNKLSKIVGRFRNYLISHMPWLQHRPVSSLSSTWRAIYFTVMFFLALIIFLNLALIPIARWSAKSAADERWSGAGQAITIIRSQDEAITKAGQQPDNSVKNAISTQWMESFTTCQTRGALVSIFSDDSTLFLLCRSPDDPQSGVVFEVTKEKGLISARNVSAGG